MKRLLSVLLCICFVCCLTITSFAVQSLNSYSDVFSVSANGDTYVQLRTSVLGNATKSFIAEVLDGCNGNGEEGFYYYVLFNRNIDSSNSSYVLRSFHFVKSPSKLVFSSASNLSGSAFNTQYKVGTQWVSVGGWAYTSPFVVFDSISSSVADYNVANVKSILNTNSESDPSTLGYTCSGDLYYCGEDGFLASVDDLNYVEPVKQYVNDKYPYIVVDKGDGNTYLGTFDADSMSASVREFVLGFWTGSDLDNYNYWVDTSSNVVYFYRYPKGDTLKFTLVSGRTMVELSSGLSFDRVQFSRDSASGLLFASGDNVSLSRNPNAYAVVYPVEMLDSLVEGERLYYRGSLGFVDNYKEPEEPSSSEPPASSSEPPASSSEPPASSSEPPASSSEPPASSSEPPIDPPVITDPNIPYDTGCWNDFQASVIGSIRLATKPGFKIFALLIGLGLMIRIIYLLIFGSDRYDRLE